ncbi:MULTISPECIES: SGNH hydrolase domain-containing protein [Pseudomonas]|nr:MULTISPECIES: SGNH hydrolase domain-containing protein [Pseudomonas]
MSKGVKIFNPSSLFCDNDNCSQRDSKHEYFRDEHHLSEAGSERVASALIDFMKKE